MKKALLFACLLLPGLLGAQALRPADRQAILDVLARQQEAWNAGDLAAFMEGYLRSDSLMFIGKSGITYGWQATLDRYRQGYPDRAAMGVLQFDVLHLQALGRRSAWMAGRWTLSRQNDRPGGYFTLIWRKKGGQWRIASDHTSG
jgi:ketosteroid isomerase-like protein